MIENLRNPKKNGQEKVYSFTVQQFGAFDCYNQASLLTDGISFPLLSALFLFGSFGRMSN